jgi:DNA-binding IclR family transcriptional regulator
MAQVQASRGANILANPQERQKFKSALASLTHYFEIIDQQKEGIKESVAEISQQYGVDKKIVRKLASTMYKHNYASIQEENEHFATLYETIIEGRTSGSSDPLDKAA